MRFLFDRHGEAQARGEGPVPAGEGERSDLYRGKLSASMSKWRKQILFVTWVSAAWCFDKP